MYILVIIDANIIFLKFYINRGANRTVRLRYNTLKKDCCSSFKNIDKIITLFLIYIYIISLNYDNKCL